MPVLQCLPPHLLRRTVGWGLGAALIVVAGGCGRIRQGVKTSMDNNPQIRQSAIDASLKSCVEAATARAPKLPGMDVKISKYCDCFATEGMARLSNSELASIGLHGGQFTPAQQAKLMQGVQLCQKELLGAKH